MSDLISRKALIKDLHGSIFYADAIPMVEEQPSVDAVPVVRCKNCTHWGTGFAGETEHVKCCELAIYMVGENGYCVYGEKV